MYRGGWCTDWTGALFGSSAKSCTLCYMNKPLPAVAAAAELALWEVALSEQRVAERQLEFARRKRKSEAFYLHAKVLALRHRADLLLAKAVETQLMFVDSE